ncbi:MULTISPECIES: hypothetical protein [Rhodococcus]|uniref:hypothetical protein n=1 Tax=Rhodococcus TaxID=1827 RepID=UPI001358F1C4|nr:MULTISPECIES: hypothetical protein [Rhodococcus]KAF0956738.1 hypothetical protein MLGJGCBP_10146 [Rhodococcus sp. T7]KAF0966611.1 hypothetical protein MLGJGCBP_00236 [Rhodococcus sp. T7]UOT08374.1 hypothetical protein MPY17_39470 [Rhodococcus opacus]
MPTDLRARAKDQGELLRAAADRVTSALMAARTELQTQHAAPAEVAWADWGRDLGAAQHETVARDALDDVRSGQATVREQIAAVANPADAETFEDQLRELMVAEAALGVQLRHARERIAAAKATIAALSSLSARVESELQAAASRTQWGEQHAGLGEQLRDALTQPPLDTIVADAQALLDSAAFAAANDRLDTLLPAELRTRAEQRAKEAAAVSADAAAAMETVIEHADTIETAATPVAGAVTIGERNLLDAEDAVAAYSSAAAGRLAVASAVLGSVAATPDLSAVQAAAIDAANNADGVTAVEHETDLGAAVAAWITARSAVDDAVLDAVVEDPDRDPETAKAVIDARAAVADASIQNPLTAARAAYDTAVRQALDEWEVEVPPPLWDALADFVSARRTLQELSDQSARAALVQDLDDAEHTVAAALNARDRELRVRWALGIQQAVRAGTHAAASAMDTDRRRQYVAGDGPAGRTRAEL